MDEFRDQEMQEVAGTMSARDLSDIVGQGDGYRDLNRREGELLNGNHEENSFKDATIGHSSLEKDTPKSDDPKMFPMDLTPPSTPQDEPLSSNAEQISLESAESAMGYLKGKESPEPHERHSESKDVDLIMGHSDHDEDSTYTKQETFPSDINKDISPLTTLEKNESSFLDEDVPSHEDSHNRSPSPAQASDHEGGISQHDLLTERLEKEPSPIPHREPSPILTFEKEESPHVTQTEHASHTFDRNSPDISKEPSPPLFDKPDSSPEPYEKQDPVEQLIDAPIEQPRKPESDDMVDFSQPDSHVTENYNELSSDKTFEKDPSPLPEVIKTEPSPTYPYEKEFAPVSEKETEPPVVAQDSQELNTQSHSSLPPKKEDMPLKDPIQTDIMASLTTKESSESPYEPQLTPEPDVLLSTPQGGTPEPESPSQMTPEPSLRDECITPPSSQQVTETSDIPFEKEISDYMHSQHTTEKPDKGQSKDVLQAERDASVFSTPEPDSTSLLNITALTDAWLQKLPPVVLDLIYWRDTQKSGVVYGSGMAFLLLLRWMSLISVVSYMSLFALTATMSFRIYKNVMQAIQKTQDGHPFKEYLDMDVTIPEDKVKHTTEVALTKLNCMVSELRRLFLVEDFVDSLKFGVLLWCLTYIGSWFNSSTLIILGYVALFTLPKVYEINQTQIDQYIDLVRTQFEEIQAKVRGLIPLGGSKEKAQ